MSLPVFGTADAILLSYLGEECFSKQEQNQNCFALLSPKFWEWFGAREVVYKTIPSPTAFQNLLVLETLSEQ